jgi:ketosteroid isomerase-like protein
MYHAIVKRIARRNFERVNAKQYDSLLADCTPNIRHHFGGIHALGGVRHDREALRLWFGRLGRVLPTLNLNVQDVWVKGWPNNTMVIVSWDADATLSDGSPYKNRGVHIIRMRWGKVFDIDAHEDSQAVAASLLVQAASGISEAVADPIVS